MARCDQAIEAVEKYKIKDKELYTIICNHINAERISPMFWTLTFYSQTISLEEKERLLLEAQQSAAWIYSLIKEICVQDNIPGHSTK